MKKLLLIALLLSCNAQKEKTAKVKGYRVQSESNPNDWIWYYLLLSNNGNYYYYSSPTPISNFSSTNWSSSSSNPIAPQVLQEIQEQSPAIEIEEPLVDLPSEIEVEMESNQETQSETPSNESSTESSESSSDGGSGDSGGGDGGGE